MASETTSPKLTFHVGERDHYIGSLDAPVILVEYADMECPYCKDVQPILRDIKRLLGDRVKFVLSPDRPTLIDAYNRASCVVVPSLGLESWNLVLLEAAACGTACVRTELPGLAWAEFEIAPGGTRE